MQSARCVPPNFAGDETRQRGALLLEPTGPQSRRMRLGADSVYEADVSLNLDLSAHFVHDRESSRRIFGTGASSRALTLPPWPAQNAFPVSKRW